VRLFHHALGIFGDLHKYDLQLANPAYGAVEVSRISKLVHTPLYNRHNITYSLLQQEKEDAKFTAERNGKDQKGLLYLGIGIRNGFANRSVSASFLRLYPQNENARIWPKI